MKNIVMPSNVIAMHKIRSRKYVAYNFDGGCANKLPRVRINGTIANMQASSPNTASGITFCGIMCSLYALEDTLNGYPSHM
jgi:hypothetical protein